MFLWGTGEDGQDGYSPTGKQWALGGDTFVVGCKIPDDAVVFPQFKLHSEVAPSLLRKPVRAISVISTLSRNWTRVKMILNLQNQLKMN